MADLDQTDDRYVGGISGRYAGLAIALLREARKRFADWKGDQPITYRSGRHLLESALFSGEMEEARSRFVQEFQADLVAGNEIYEYLQRRVDEEILNSGSEHAMINGGIEFNMANILAYRSRSKGMLGLQLDEVGSALSILVRNKILGLTLSNTYRLLVRSPFLVAHQFDVFVSCPREEREVGQALGRLIREKGRVHGKEVVITMFPPLDSDVPLPSEINLSIDIALNKIKNLVVLFREKYKTGSVTSEISSWFGKWGNDIPNLAKAFPVSLDGASVPGMPFSNVPPLLLREDTMASIADQIFLSLVPR
jgi:hypothetical protein